jgi:ketosteroid isomerase-like protein
MQRRESQVGTVQSNRSSSVNAAEAPEDLHKLFAQALNSGDLDALVALYAFDAFLMTRSGSARGIMAIGRALAEYVAMKPTIQLTTRKVVQVEDTALLVA